ncbi:glycosyltransferase family 2 protein [Bailinhaonella thermotolerans]|uniref:Glycosyltransferase family 2 protein n=1 Tax=Bailinhaonella thermotolerans TaxID=1070861 RepID=A0A3A4AP64_9ACTN|nr:glycosyltransferase family 2 protein [Bailinhaonella thermotolerans]RJL30811.1 glycosyltransferase family 2 protein [Bailinhaonella thermotolerans]
MTEGKRVRVSVIIPVYNCRSYLPKSVDSVLGQTIGTDALELILVDDGSTDGSAELVDEYAAAHPEIVRVHHHDAPSGGPGRPRNTALDMGPRGDYVYFLDADDWLGEDALRRMVNKADKWGSDILLGKMISVSGYPAPKSMFGYNQPKADLFTSKVYWTCSATKLFRRELIDRLELRFPHHFGEDEPFTTHAYLHAETISVLSDYDYVFIRMRDDGSNMVAGSVDYVAGAQRTKSLMEMIVAHTEPGPGRDFMVYRNVVRGYLRFFDGYWLRLDESEQRKVAEAVRADLPEWLTPGVWERLDPGARLRAHLVREDRIEELRQVVAAEGTPRVLVEGDRLYQLLPGFREWGVPDDRYDATRKLPLQRRLTRLSWTAEGALEIAGHAYMEGLPGEGTEIAVLLTERESKAEKRFAVRREPTSATPDDGVDYGDAGFVAAVDPGELADGVWDAFLVFRAGEFERTVRFGFERDADSTVGTPRLSRERVVQPYYTEPYGNLSIDVGENSFTLDKHLKLTKAAWDDRNRLVVGLDVKFGRQRPPASIVHSLVWRRQDGEGEVRVPATGFSTAVPMPERPGTWALYAEFDLGEGKAGLPLGADRSAGKATAPGPRSWWRGLRGRVARPGYEGASRDGNLIVVIESLIQAKLSRILNSRTKS